MAQVCSVPFCFSGCTVKDHHPLVRILCEFPCNPSLPCDNQQNRLEDAIMDAQANGWGISDDVPECAPNCPKLPLMHWAAAVGKGNVLKRLVEDGFSPKVANASLTALSLAMRYMLMSFAKCNEVAQAGAAFQSVASVLYTFEGNVQDAQGRVALNSACEQYVSSLSQPGPESSFRKKVLTTLLSLADSSTAQGLSLVSHADMNGNTSLHILAQRDECSDLVEALLTMGADPTLQNKHGQTPCEVAQACSQHLVARCLFRATAVPMASAKGLVATGFTAGDRQVTAVAMPLNGQHAVLDVSQQVREQVKNHVNSRHHHAQPSLGLPADNHGRPALRPSFHTPMAANVKQLRDVCTVDFAIVNQQCVHAAAGASDMDGLQNGACSPTVSALSSFMLPINGDIGSELDRMCSSYDLPPAVPDLRHAMGSPPPLLQSAPVCNGLIGSDRQVLRHAISAALTDGPPCSDDTGSSESSDEDEDMGFEEDLLLNDDDEFIATMNQIKSCLKGDALSTIVTAESERRLADYQAALSQQDQAHDSAKQLTSRLSAARQDCQNMVSAIEDVKLQMLLVSDELSQRRERCGLLDHERQAVDSQYKLAQLQHMACSRALESIPLAYQMNVAFEEEQSTAPAVSPQANSTATAAAPAQPSAQLEMATPNFDSASVSSSLSSHVLPM